MFVRFLWFKLNQRAKIEGCVAWKHGIARQNDSFIFMDKHVEHTILAHAFLQSNDVA
jgi:hypothetical protein